MPLCDYCRTADGVVRKLEAFLKEHFREPDAIAQAVNSVSIPERTLKRRFKAATGVPLIGYLQNVRIELAKQILESTQLQVEEISAEAGYSDTSFFRRLFKRLVGVTPLTYRRMFGDSPKEEVHGRLGRPNYA